MKLVFFIWIVDILGGRHVSTENTNTIECYNPENNEWKLLCPMKTRRYKAGAAVVDGRIYVCGGEEGCDRYMIPHALQLIHTLTHGLLS